MRKQHHRNKGKIAVLGLGSALVFGNATQAKFDGFYAGASVGYLNQTISLDAKQNPTNVYAHLSNAHSQQGLSTADFLFGWGKIFEECFYAGLEGKIDAVMRGNKKFAEDTNFIYLSGRKGPGMAILARFGCLISPNSMIYGGVGVKAIKFEYDFFEKADKISAFFSKRSLHLLTEIGTEFFFNTSKNLALRFSYSFMPKQNLIRNTTNFPINHVYRENGFLNIGTTEHTLKVSLIYHF